MTCTRACGACTKQTDPCQHPASCSSLNLPEHMLETEIAPGYRVYELLRSGSLLDVYDCWSVQRRCRCVVKVIRPERAHEAHARRRLLREGRLLRRLAHPHLVRVFEVIERPRTAVVLETLGGGTL